MPFVIPGKSPEEIQTRRRRILISGEPNSRKTTALLTLPKPIAILSYPGEKGYDTIPDDDPDVLKLVWRVAEKPQDAYNTVKDVFEATNRIIAEGKHVTFAGDGLHKLFDPIIDMVTDGAFSSGEDFEAKLYTRAYNIFLDYLNKTMHSKIPVVAFTTWSEWEKDRMKKEGEREASIPAHIYPALPGKMAKRIMGEFSVVVHQTIRKLKPTDDDAVGVWQTRPFGDVWGAGLKGPADVVKKIPTFIPADYRVLEAVWSKAETVVAQPKEGNA
jgi:hypothetical protein